MAVQINFAFRRVNSRRKIDSMGNDNTMLVAWWYCGIYKNTIAQSQPLALVAFRELQQDKTLSDDIIYHRVPLALLGQVRMGSLWQGGRMLANAVFEVKDFVLKFSKGAWWFTSFFKAVDRNLSSPFPQQIYPLAFERDKNWLVQFRLQNGGTLIVPCLEFFTRCYGRSGELRRILSTYPWEGAGGCMERFFSPIDEPEESG